MNRWGIPEWLEQEIRARDLTCVYCDVRFDSGDRKNWASWEHIINDSRICTIQNLALCCMACNSSKGTKDLAEWLKSDYCRRRGITRKTLAPVIRAALAKGAHYEWPPKLPRGKQRTTA